MNRELLTRYGGPIPRYTSYPAAPQWTELTAARGYQVLRSVGGSPEPLSIYVHLPFCKKLCWYCGCNMMVTRSGSLVERYLEALEREARAVGEIVGKRRVVQLHLGGGTPTFLDCEQLERVHATIANNFALAANAELAIEIHPPVTTLQQLETLRRLGFSRLSMGVQDFDRRVQKAVNRIQPFEQTRDLIVASRELGFASINIDLMYGLPFQTPERFAETLDRVGELRPDRVALFGYAHLPELKPHQRLIDAAALPDSPGRLDLFALGAERLGALGYTHIGLDHFSLQNDELHLAQRAGRLRRDFMGYTAGPASELVGLGASAISDIAGSYLQNAREVEEYVGAVARDGLATRRGLHLSADDLARRAVIQALFCDLELDTRALGGRLGVRFEQHFADELARLQPLARDGLVELSPGRIRVTHSGRMLLRNVAAAFDAYLHRPSAAPARYSRAI